MSQLRKEFGADLARTRESAGFCSQMAWAQALNRVAGTDTLTRHEVSRWERGIRVPDSWLPAIAVSLSVPIQELTRRAATARRSRKPAGGSSPQGVQENGPAALVLGPLTAGHPPSPPLTIGPDAGLLMANAQIQLPPGRFMPGVLLDAQVHPATREDRILAVVPDGYGDDPFLTRPGHRLVIGRVADADEQLFAVDAQRVRRQLRDGPRGARLPIPAAYGLDDLAAAILWAVVNFDVALLADDGLLHRTQPELAGYARLSRSAVSVDVSPDLTPVGRMFLGSSFCAQHIARHASDLSGSPTFWTREQRGEEAAAWLLFAHKHDYLQATAARHGGAGSRMTRAFCVPREAVDTSSIAERILLLLAVALIESYAVHAVVTDEPDYASTPGFLADRGHHAIVASWIGTAGLWHVDVTDHRPTLRSFTDATDYAEAHSVIAHPESHGRLRYLADYLQLDWPRLQRRCHELGEYGTAGIARPHSRHLSTDGLERACRYLSGVAVTGLN